MEEIKTRYTGNGYSMNYLTYLFVRIILGIFRLLPLTTASALGGRVMRFVGPKMKKHKVAEKNLKLIYPNHTQEWRDRVVMQMWDHLGRVFAELPALKSGELMGHISGVHNEHVLEDLPQTIFVSAHFGQWELCVPAAKRYGIGKIASLYRHVNNPKLDALLRSYREQYHDQLIRKKSHTALAMVKALQDGYHLAMLIDQRLGQGPRMKFLGIEGSTNVSAMKLSVKTGVPITLAFAIRNNGVEFNGDIEGPIYPPEEGTEEEKVASMSRQVFDIIEQKIHAHPEQYLWLHNRWK